MARVKSLADRPIEQHSSPNIGGSMSSHRGVVLHIAQGTYRGTISWQMNPNQRYASGGTTTTSSTWIVGKDAGEWAQMADSTRIAWTQRDGSRTWLSIELAGWAPDKPTAWQIEACAQLLAWAHREHGVPLAVADHPGQRGLGHHSMDREWLGEDWGHEACPGKGVIGAKAAIVARAKEIEEDDDVSARELWTGHTIRTQHKESKGVPPDVALSWAWNAAVLASRGVDRLEAGQAAILAAVAGQNVADAVEGKLAEHRQLVLAEFAELAELVRQAQSGERDAASVVDELGRRLARSPE